MRRGGRISPGEATNLTTLVTALKSGGIWPIIDRVWLGPSMTMPGALTCLKSRNFLRAVGTVVHTPKTGVTYVQGLNVNYLVSSFVPLTNGGAMTQNSAHGLSWPITAVLNTSHYDMGCNGATSTHMIRINSRTTSDIFQAGMNNNAGTVATGPADGTPACWIFTRRLSTGAGALNLLKNGANIATATTTSTGLSEQPLWLGCNNNNGAVQGSNNARGWHFLGVGGALDDTQGLAYYTALDAFKTAQAAL